MISLEILYGLIKFKSCLSGVSLTIFELHCTLDWSWLVVTLDKAVAHGLLLTF